MRWRPDPSSRRPAPEPRATDDRLAMAVGTLAWLASGALALALRGRLATAGHGWWFSVCVAGAVLGLYGWWHEWRRARRRARDSGR